MALLCRHVQFNAVNAETLISEQDLKIYASCDTYIRVTAPSSFSSQYSFISSKNGPPQLVGTFLQGTGESYTTHSFKPDFPNRSWYSVLFEGPNFGIDRFCYGSARTDKVILTYRPVKNFMMSYSTNPEFSSQEIDKFGSNANRSVINLTPDPNDKSHIAAGRNSNNPYWLTLAHAYNFYEPVETSLQFTIP